MVDAACFSAVYAQSGIIKSVLKTPSDVLPVHAKALIDGLKRIDDTRHHEATLDTLDRRIEEFKNHYRSVLTDLGSRNYVEDAVEALKTRTLTQRNAMKVFDDGSTFVLADDEERS